jgi:uncharacterized protein YndB with AHSA1/START domain
MRPVSITRSIAAPVDDVWAAISVPGYLELVHPFCARNPVDSWPGRDSCDEIHYRSGWVYRRSFTEWVDGVGYDLDIGAVGEPTSHVTWRLTASTPRSTDLTIRVWPRPLIGVVGLDGPTRLAIVGPLMRRYLRSVTAGVEWYVVQQEPVTANQFGSHPWFSPRGATPTEQR